MSHNILKLSIFTLITLTVVVFGAIVLADPYFFTPAKKLYKTGAAKMEEGLIGGSPTAYTEAAIYFEALVEKGNIDKDTFDKLYWCYRFGKKHLEAENVASRALEIHPGDIEFLFHRAESRLEQEKYQLAIEDYDLVASKSKNFKYLYDAYYSRGAAKFKLGNKEQAEADRALAVKIAPQPLETYEEHFEEKENNIDDSMFSDEQTSL
ncbi:tetratricopeptide repeat protein [Pontibacter sp. SGAir0037]|uniref:tetratricopeptide repeat protein n=1 Tax=Pontibacter sp. SGAir0037 TaxID=2571030 RepID=UPI0010CCE901|nr:hypothetical protein [Pontibacter sp. SGAir0037]QCR21814.1 hypothetical protein C1N53_05310 [Pontibacter sp. SGAir0037]